MLLSDGENEDNTNGEWCDFCKGDGRIMQEETTIKEKGQAGDAGLLKVAKDAFTECARLKGLHVKKTDKVKVSGAIGHAHILARGQIDLSRATPEAILDAKASLARLRLEAKSSAGGKGSDANPSEEFKSDEFNIVDVDGEPQ